MEHIRTPKVENVKLMDKYNPKASPTGNLYLTTSHLIFIEDKLNKETWILHMLMSSIEKPLLTTSGSQLKISCSNFQTVTFTIQRDRDAHDVYQSLLELSKPKEVQDLYCFSYNPKGELTQSTGWYFHDLQAEFQRQGVPNENWVTCSLNQGYKLCPTYPKYIYVPSIANKETIEGSAKFRSKGRLPVLTYLHSNGAAIIRCAQPLVGMAGLRSSHDEHYVECLRRATPAGVLTRGGGGASETIAPNIQIIDTRPAMNAMANKAGGKGYESDKYYENINFSFKGIENIHKMRSSLKDLINTVTAVPGGGGASIENFMSGLANSGWLKHVKAVLDVSIAIADCILSNRSVIVHCSDGWDRTSQTCALACLMLDGYYRTIQGFQALIEKDWLAFGHKFQDRCGHIQGDPQEISPTFIQFLDCVWQLTQLYPQAFQFNERYLITIEEHVYSCQYGTFIGNCEKQREELELKKKTYSLWGYLAVSFSTEDQFVNPLYDKENKELTNQILRPRIVPQNIKFWRELYCRFERGAHPREPLLDLLAITQNHTTSLEDHGRQLTKTINYYTQKINVAKSASGVLKSMGINSPSNLPSSHHPVQSPGSLQEKRGSVADSNTSNVSVGGASSTNNSVLMSPSKAMVIHANDDGKGHSNKSVVIDQVSPSISIGEEALNEATEVNSDTMTSMSKNNSKSDVGEKSKEQNIDKPTSVNQTFCDPLLRRESESDNSAAVIAPLTMQNIKDMNISKVVEKCQSRLFRLGESFVSTSWPADPPTIEVDDGSTKKQMLDISPNEVIGDSSDNIETSEEEDASSSVTITSPRATDHPSTLKTDLNKPPIAHDRAELELDSVAVDWVNWRLSRHCNVCKREFDSSATGVSTHCRRCGQLYCMRCIPRKVVLRGHESRRPVPVCNICYKALTFCGEIPDTQSKMPSQTTAESATEDGRDM